MTVKLTSTETWYQDTEDTNLWHGNHGVIVNTAALEERTFYFDIIRVPASSAAQQERDYSAPCA